MRSLKNGTPNVNYNMYIYKALPVDAGGEAEAAAPGAIAEFAQERRLGIGGLLGGEALGADDEGAIGGFDLDRVALHARQFQGDGFANPSGPKAW